MADSIRGVLLDSVGRPINSAVVRIYDAGTSNLSSLFSDKALTTPVTNDGSTSPLSEADGSYGPFYVANGRYDIKPVKAGYSFDDTDLADYEVEDVKEQAMTISAQHTFSGAPIFNPPSAGPGFSFGANAQGQPVPGMAHLFMITVQTPAGVAGTLTANLPLTGHKQTLEVSEQYVMMLMSTSGVIKKLAARFYTNTYSQPIAITLRKNLSDQALTVSIPASSTSLITDDTHEVAFAAGDWLAWKVQAPAGTGTATYLGIAATMVINS